MIEVVHLGSPEATISAGSRFELGGEDCLGGVEGHYLFGVEAPRARFQVTAQRRACSETVIAIPP